LERLRSFPGKCFWRVVLVISSEAEIPGPSPPPNYLSPRPGILPQPPVAQSFVSQKLCEFSLVRSKSAAAFETAEPRANRFFRGRLFFMAKGVNCA
jgi:hypothetical protein